MEKRSAYLLPIIKGLLQIRQHSYLENHSMQEIVCNTYVDCHLPEQQDAFSLVCIESCPQTGTNHIFQAYIVHAAKYMHV